MTLPLGWSVADLSRIAREVWPGWCESPRGELEAVLAIEAVLFGKKHYATADEAARIRELAAEMKGREEGAA